MRDDGVVMAGWLVVRVGLRPPLLIMKMNAVNDGLKVDGIPLVILRLFT